MSAHAAAADLRSGSYAMAAVAREARDDDDARMLAYFALYACRAGGGADLDRYRRRAGYLRDDTFVFRLFADVPDRVDVTGWKATGQEGDRVLVEKDGMAAFVESDALAEPARPGATVTFRMPALGAGRMPGFVVRTGAVPLLERSLLTRFYLAVRPAAAAWALGPLARTLDGAGLAFEMKVLAHPLSYLRRDACVLYVGSDDEDRATRLVTAAVAGLPPTALRRHGPRLTGPVAPGVGMAHEPSDLAEPGLSHGQWVAGLFRAAAGDTTDPRALARRVAALIAEAGRDPERPHLRGRGTGR